MSILPVQLILLVVCALGVYKTVERLRKDELSRGGSWLWLILWFALAWLAVWPDSTFALAKFLGIGRGADVAVYGAIVVIFFILFRIMVKQEKLNREITTLTRAIALNNAAEEDKVV